MHPKPDMVLLNLNHWIWIPAISRSPICPFCVSNIPFASAIVPMGTPRVIKKTSNMPRHTKNKAIVYGCFQCKLFRALLLKKSKILTSHGLEKILLKLAFVFVLMLAIVLRIVLHTYGKSTTFVEYYVCFPKYKYSRDYVQP
jgi:hypothetical protein